MIIELNRNKVFYIGLSVIALFLLLNRLEYYFKSDITSGQVIKINNPYGRYSAPVIRFSTEKYVVTFEGVKNMDLKRGEQVKVIYNIKNPEEAEVYSFVGFVLTPLLYCIVPVILLFSAVFSFFSPTQMIAINSNKLFKNEKIKSTSELFKKSTSNKK
jgi:hypothetical protein